MLIKNKFEAYEVVRKSGITNMFDVKAVMAYSGLEKEECLDIMKNYGKYMEKYPDVRKEK